MAEDLIEVIENVVSQKTIYHRHYYGTVMSNFDLLGVSLDRGVIHVAADELSWDAEDPLSWGRCFPRTMQGIVTPNVGQTVDIYFMNGDPGRPVYMGLAHEVLGNPIVNYALNPLPTNHILFESPILKSLIKVDDITGTVTISPALFGEFGIGPLSIKEPFVLGNQLLTFLTALVIELNSLITVFNAHSHLHPPGPSPPAPTSPPVSPATPATPPTPIINSLVNSTS